jgi:dsDNA-specific endonuclease/ATPase MutS2
VQALGGGSLELPALAAARDGRVPALTAATPEGGEGPPPIEVPIEDALDLHAFAPRDVPAVVGDYLEAAHTRGFTQVRLIHGRGIGVQRSIVQSLLARHPLVAAFGDAPPERGGWGATLVVLRPPPA